ncbi:MAG: site-specific integrase [Treponema sp.]|jgi:site-specific recombinase XerD|nr:site-specific integrase [Treponema sp.]
MKSKSAEFLELLESFLNVYLPCAVGVRANTVKSYKDAFRLLLKYMFEQKHINADKIAFTDLDYTTMLGYLDWLEKERGCGIATRNQRLAILSSFADYAQNRSVDAALFRRDIGKLPSKKSRNTLRTTFTLEEITILLNIPKDSSTVEMRNKTLLSVMYASGARAQEICDLAIRDVRFNGDAASLILTGKGGKTRKVGIPKACAALLKKYIDKRGLSEKNERHVFSSQTHEHMAISCVEEIFKKYVRLAREKNPKLFCGKSYTPHSMRHTTATHMLEAGVPIVVIKNFLGHASLQSTQIYAEATQSTVDRHIKEWNEKWGPKPNFTPDEAETPFAIPDFLKNK